MKDLYSVTFMIKGAADPNVFIEESNAIEELPFVADIGENQEGDKHCVVVDYQKAITENNIQMTVSRVHEIICSCLK